MPAAGHEWPNAGWNRSPTVSVTSQRPGDKIRMIHLPNLMQALEIVGNAKGWRGNSA
jgi:hypothetical protein